MLHKIKIQLNVVITSLFTKLHLQHQIFCGRGQLKCDGTRAENRFRLSAKRTSPFKSVGASVRSTTGSRGVRISGSNGYNAGYTMFRVSVNSTVYPLHSPVSPSLPLFCVNVCHHISTGAVPPLSHTSSWLPRHSFTLYIGVRVKQVFLDLLKCDRIA